MKCQNCGEEILSGNKCLNCSFETENFQATNNEVQNYNNSYNQNEYNQNNYNQNVYNQNNAQNSQIYDKKSNMATFISFLLPDVGLVLYFLNRRTKPIFAKSFKSGFLIRIVVNIILIALLSIFYVFLIMVIFIGIVGLSYY